MEMEQMMARILAEIRTKKMDINLREMKADMLAKMDKMDARIKANNEKSEVLQHTFVCLMDAHHSGTEANHEEVTVAIKASHERIEVTEACLEKVKEPTSMEMKSVVVHEEVPTEDAAVETGRALNKWHGDENLAVGHRGKPMERTQGNGGFWKKLATAHRGIKMYGGVEL
jgi:hypothetical protein